MVKAGNSRLLRLFFCTCGKISTAENEDDVPYTRNVKVDKAIEYKVIEDFFGNDERSEKDSLSSETNDLSLPSKASADYLEEALVIKQKKRPQRPNTLRWSVIPHPEQVLHKQDLQQILLKLDLQSQKLDKILQKIDDIDELSCQLHSKVESFKMSVQKATNRVSMMDNDAGSKRSSNTLPCIPPSISESCEASEHDEIFGSVENSAQVAEIIKDQFNALKRCAVEHNNNQTEDMEFCEVMSAMETDLNMLPVYASEKDRELFHSRKFQWPTDPSPKKPENHEMTDFKRAFSHQPDVGGHIESSM
uniref:uncharacterized protein LOC120342347 isoform X2 n=1 Tax=Styela clava TaxID=7725 RepID=UPI00193A509C|nr:uncharacterized protein LOC120342347 isoform X2 [Styela clava]